MEMMWPRSQSLLCHHLASHLVLYIGYTSDVRLKQVHPLLQAQDTCSQTIWLLLLHRTCIRQQLSTALLTTIGEDEGSAANAPGRTAIMSMVDAIAAALNVLC